MTNVRLFRSRSARRLFLFVALVGGLVFLWQRGPAAFKAGVDSVGSHDFLAYWSGARLLRSGSDPYEPAALLAMQRAAGSLATETLQVWNPPWLLTLVLPLAYLPFPLATTVWFVLQFGLLLGSGALLWRYFAPGDRRYWIGFLLAAAFTPGIFALRIGQISGWLLVGVVGFLYGVRYRRDVFAGAALALLMIKPHITYLLWPTALWWAWRNRRWQILVGWVAGLVMTTSVALLFVPRLLVNYQRIVTGPPLDWVTPTLGTYFRLVFGVEQNWLQLLPSLLAGLGLLVWLWRRRGPWHWEKVISPLLLASAITAPFGWSFDWLVLLPVAVDLVVRARSGSHVHRAVVVGLLALIQLALYLQSLLRLNYVFHFWYPLALTGLYWWSGRHLPVQRQGNPQGEGL